MALSPELSSSTCKDPMGQLKVLMESRMPLLAETEGAVAGIFHKEAEEYVILAGVTDCPVQGYLIVADKLLPFVGDRPLLLSILDQLNRGSLTGVHQLLSYPGRAIYLYKQAFCTQGKLSQPFFDHLLEEGVQEFRQGLRYICQQLESILAEKRGPPGSRMGTGRN